MGKGNKPFTAHPQAHTHYSLKFKDTHRSLQVQSSFGMYSEEPVNTRVQRKAPKPTQAARGPAFGLLRAGRGHQTAQKLRYNQTPSTNFANGALAAKGAQLTTPKGKRAPTAKNLANAHNALRHLF